MASGLPVVVSKCAGAAELIEDGNGGILLDNPKSPEEIAEKVNMLIKNKRLRSKISKQARKVVEEYAWDKVAEKWLEVFEEIK
jgi:glycosyltransferase involved in cell wall biosynthesis